MINRNGGAAVGLCNEKWGVLVIGIKKEKTIRCQCIQMVRKTGIIC